MFTILVNHGERGEVGGLFGEFDTAEDAEAFLDEVLPDYAPDPFQGPWFNIVLIQPQEQMMADWGGWLE